jgi:hypothetical protein
VRARRRAAAKKRLTWFVLEEMTVGLVYTITLPAPGAPDVTARELHVTLDQGADNVQTLPASATSAQVACNEGQAVSLFLVDVDDAGNESPPSPTLSYTAADVIPPPAPGPLTIASVSET